MSTSLLEMALMEDQRKLLFISRVAAGAVVTAIPLFCRAAILDLVQTSVLQIIGRSVMTTTTSSEQIELKINSSATGTNSLSSTVMVVDIKAILKTQLM